VPIDPERRQPQLVERVADELDLLLAPRAEAVEGALDVGRHQARVEATSRQKVASRATGSRDSRITPRPPGPLPAGPLRSMAPRRHHEETRSKKKVECHEHPGEIGRLGQPQVELGLGQARHAAELVLGPRRVMRWKPWSSSWPRRPGRRPRGTPSATRKRLSDGDPAKDTSRPFSKSARGCASAPRSRRDAGAPQVRRRPAEAAGVAVGDIEAGREQAGGHRPEDLGMCGRRLVRLVADEHVGLDDEPLSGPPRMPRPHRRGRGRGRRPPRPPRARSCRSARRPRCCWCVRAHAGGQSGAAGPRRQHAGPAPRARPRSEAHQPQGFLQLLSPWRRKPRAGVDGLLDGALVVGVGVGESRLVDLGDPLFRQRR